MPRLNAIQNDYGTVQLKVITIDNESMSVIKPGANQIVYNWMEGFNENTVRKWIEACLPGVEERSPIPRITLQSFLNPFSELTAISYQLPATSKPSLKIYNIIGNLVRTVVDEVGAAGYKEKVWDGKDSGGMQVPSGLYFLKFSAGEVSLTKKLIVI